MKVLISWMVAVLCLVIGASPGVARVVPPSGPRIVVLPPLNQTIDQFLRDGVGAGSVAGLEPGTLPLSAYWVAADGSAVNITPLVQWTFDGTGATVDEEGVVRRTGDGQVRVCAYFAGLEGHIEVTLEASLPARSAPPVGTPPADGPPPEPRDVRGGVRALIHTLEARGVPVGGLRLATDGTLVFVSQGYLGTTRLNDRFLTAEFVTPPVTLGVGVRLRNTEVLAGASGVVLLTDGAARNVADRNFFDVTGSLRADVVDVLHESLHGAIDAAGGDGFLGSKEGTEEAFIQVWVSMLPVSSNAGELLSTAAAGDEPMSSTQVTRLRDSLRTLRTLYQGWATLCARLYPTNQADQSACQVFVNLVLGLLGPGWTDGDQNGLPDYVDNLIRRYETKHGPIPWGPEPRDNPTHPLPPKVPEEGGPRDLPNQPSGPPAPGEP